MLRPYLIAVASLGVATGIATTAHSATAECSGDELTLERLQEDACVRRIPLPTARSHILEDSAVAAHEASPLPEAAKTWEFLEAPGAKAGETRKVRLVGPRFLPDQSEAIDFRDPANVDVVNTVFQRTVSYLGLGSEGSAPADVADRQAGEIQQARVSLELRMTSN